MNSLVKHSHCVQAVSISITDQPVMALGMGIHTLIFGKAIQSPL
jgi:hypothetical protein